MRLPFLKRSLTNLLNRLRGVSWILHPFLLLFYSIFSLIVENPSFPPEAMLRTLAVGFLVLFLILSIGYFRWSGERTALFLSGIIILFFAYGHLLNLVRNYQGTGLNRMGEWLLLVPILAAAILWIYFVASRLHQVSVFTQYFLAVGLVVNLFPVWQQLRSNTLEGIVQDQLIAYQNQIDDQLHLGRDGEGSEWPDRESPRDIYYIVLDAYTRGDVLEDLYGYDNSAFLKDLATRGFYIAGESQANYISTEFSLASSLNMSYLTDIPEVLEEQGGADENSVKSFAASLIASNALQRYLQARGYTVVAFESGYDSTIVRNADIYMQSPDVDRGSLWRVGFEMMLLDSSLGRLFMQAIPETADALDWLFDLHRGRVLYTLEHLSDFAKDQRPTFVYAHIISPHTPYVFGPNGERIEHQDPFTLLDANPGNPDNIRYYRDQVHYLNSLVLEVIDEILLNSPQEPIIFLQADHGSKVYKELHPEPEVQCLLNLPILNAYYFPEGETEAALYPSISPVNSFRVLLNRYFNQDLELLGDDSFILDSSSDPVAFKAYQDVIASCP